MGRSSCVRLFALACAIVPAGLSSVMAAEPAVVLSVDPIRSMQAEAQHSGRASWGHWGDQPDRYDSWSNHSNRLVPIYTFGMTLQSVTGKNSVYRSAKDLARLYGRVPDNTLNPTANYCDQTDVYRLQQEAVAAGKTRIILLVFDGMDWTTTRTAAIATTGTVTYREGRGTGLSFQDYRGAPTDFGRVSQARPILALCSTLMPKPFTIPAARQPVGTIHCEGAFRRGMPAAAIRAPTTGSRASSTS